MVAILQPEQSIVVLYAAERQDESTGRLPLAYASWWMFRSGCAVLLKPEHEFEAEPDW